MKQADGKKGQSLASYLKAFCDFVAELKGRQIIMLAVGGLLLTGLCAVALPYAHMLWLRLLFLFLPPTAGSLMLVACHLRPATRTLPREMCCVFFSAAFFSSLLMSRNYFYSGLDLSLLLTAATAIVLVLIYAAPSVGSFAIYAAMCALWFLDEPTAAKGWVYLALLALTLPFGALLIRKGPRRPDSQLFLYVWGLSPLLLLLNHPERAAYGVWFFTLYAYFTVLVLLDRRINGPRAEFYRRPLGIIGFVGTLLLLSSGIRSHVWEDSITAGADWDINILFFALIITICLIYIESVLRGHISTSSFLMCALYFLGLTSYLAAEFYFLFNITAMAWVLGGLLCLLFLGSMAISAGRKNRLMTGVLVILALVAAYITAVVPKGQFGLGRISWGLGFAAAASGLLVLIFAKREGGIKR